VEERPRTRSQGAQRGERVEGGEDYCSKIKIAGFGSLNETTTNFDVEIPYMIPFPPMLPAMVPFPFVGDEKIEYVALTVAPKVGPLAAPISSVPIILPVGMAPSAVNSPEKIATPRVAGVVVDPPYVPFTVLLVKGPTAWGSANPNKTELSGTMKKAWLALTI